MDTVVNNTREAQNGSKNMAYNTPAEIAALRRMSPAQLRDKYLELFGEPSRSGNKDFLFKRLAWRIQSLTEGTLSERARARAAELARDADLRMTMPKQPTVTAGAQTSIRPAPPPVPGRLPLPGTVLTRSYRGRLLEVTVLPKGFEWEGEVYRSLTAVAQAVTGSHWNGLQFFGLKSKGEQ
jgi:hypothetical protein